MKLESKYYSCLRGPFFAESHIQLLGPILAEISALLFLSLLFEMAMLTIHPSELLVEGPYDAEKIVRFAVINNLPKNQVFKIKSTKPDRIGISPHCGFIRALDRIEVTFFNKMHGILHDS